MKILITGGAGFIGTNLCGHILDGTEHSIVCLDALTYAADKAALEVFEKNGRYTFYEADICDAPALDKIFKDEKPDAVMHLAAESHVDRSLARPGQFITTNITGTYNLLETARDYFENEKKSDAGTFRFHHISTDEVYGALGDEGSFREDTPYNPRSPYSASKAASDHLVRAWGHSYGLPFVISNCSNNYGPHQYPEKLIPVIIKNALRGEAVPIYGEGKNVRDWLYVKDHAGALLTVLENGVSGESYNIGGEAEIANIDLAHMICDLLDQLAPDSRHKPYRDLIRFVTDRAGHDYRYAMDIGKIRRKLRWQPQTTFETGILQTIKWYLAHPRFLERS